MPAPNYLKFLPPEWETNKIHHFKNRGTLKVLSFKQAADLKTLFSAVVREVSLNDNRDRMTHARGRLNPVYVAFLCLQALKRLIPVTGRILRTLTNI